MGRYAQRRRSGGGPSSLVSIARAEKTGPTTALIIWTGDFDPGVIDPVQLTTGPDGWEGASIAPVNDSTWEVTFADVITDNVWVRWSGSTIGVVAFQQVNFS